jgi:hypothetical protein
MTHRTASCGHGSTMTGSAVIQVRPVQHRVASDGGLTHLSARVEPISEHAA